MTERNALLFAAVTSLTWGLTGVFVRLLPTIPPLTITAGRLVIALLAVLPILLLNRDSQHSVMSALRYPVSYVLALLLAGYYFLATAAFQMAPVAEVALLLSTPPLFVLAIRRIRGEHSSRAEIGGALLAVSGIAMILAPRISFAGDPSSKHFFGDIIAICAAALTAIYAYTYRVLAENGRSPESTGVSLLTFAIASRRLPAIITAMISLFIPLFSGLFAFLILGERLSIMFLVGCALVLWGVAMIIRNNRTRTSD